MGSEIDAVDVGYVVKRNDASFRHPVGVIENDLGWEIAHNGCDRGNRQSVDAIGDRVSGQDKNGPSFRLEISPEDVAAAYHSSS
jgi:hypothetical protein